MKATITFEYDPLVAEETSYINNLQKAEDFKQVLWDYDQWLRGLLKHGDISDAQAEIYQECRDKLYEFMNENKVDLYEV